MLVSRRLSSHSHLSHHTRRHSPPKPSSLHSASVASVTESGDLTGATAIGLPANARPSSVSKSPLPRPSADLTDLDGPSGAVNSSTTEQRRSSIWDRDKAHPVLKDPVWQADKRRSGSSASDKSEKKTVFSFSPRK